MKYREVCRPDDYVFGSLKILVEVRVGLVTWGSELQVLHHCTSSSISSLFYLCCQIKRTERQVTLLFWALGELNLGFMYSVLDWP